jgi:folate-binding Fe-S cluster repair protein YgfZ
MAAQSFPRDFAGVGLEDRRAEAAYFAQSATADIEAESGGATYAALLTPREMLFDFFVVRDGEDFLIDCAASQKAELIKRLGFYRLRAKVTIADPADREVGVSPEKPVAGLTYADPRDAAMGFRAIAPKAPCPKLPAIMGCASGSGSPTPTPIWARASSFRMRPISISWGR